MGRVEGKVAFVTGAARGQGRSHAVRLAEEGADIIAVDICEDFGTVNYAMSSAEDLEETVRLVEKLDRRIVAVKADTRDRAQLVAAVNQGVAEFGKLDVIVANAGIAAMQGEPKIQAWIDGYDTNMVGTINAIHAGLPHLTAGGSIIATGSVAAFMNTQGATMDPGSDPGGYSYTLAKQQLSEFVHTLASQLAPQGIRANVVHPTNCNTNMLQSAPMYKAFRPDLENPTREDAEPAFYVQQAMKIPFIEPVDISNMVLFLASEEARYVTGMQMRVDAGSYLQFNNFKA